MRDCDVMFAALGIDPEGYVQFWTHPQNGQSYREYSLDKDLSITLVSGYDVKMRHSIVTRWQELEHRPIADPMVALSDPAIVRSLLLTYSEKVIELQPKADAFDRLVTADGSLCITDAAKSLGVRPKDLIDFLRSHGWIYTPPGGRGHIAYAAKLQQGLMEHKTTTVHRSDGSEKVVTQARISAKGLTRLAQEFPPPARAA